MSKIKVGVIGVGGIAQSAHIPAYKKNQDVEVVAIADINQVKAEYVSEKFDIPNVFSDYKDLLAMDEIDAVSVCTPNIYHRPMSIDALNAGKHVICEKPVAAKGSDAEAIIAAAKANDKIFMAAQVQRFYPVTKALRNFTADGVFGDIYYIKGGYIRRRGIPGLGGWFTNKDMALGGCMMDIGVHALDRMYWIMGSPEPVSASGMVVQKFADSATDGGWPPYETRLGDVFSDRNDVDDMASGFVKFADGSVLLVEASWAGNTDSYSYLDLMGTKAGARLFNDDFKIYGEMGGHLADYSPIINQRVDAFYEEIKHFTDCIKTGKEPLVKGREVINIAKILEAIYKSSESGKEVQISEL